MLQKKLGELFNERILPQLGDMSDRDVTTCRFAFYGLSNKEIGELANVQEKTVKGYLTNAYKHLNVTKRCELQAYLTYLAVTYDDFVILHEKAKEAERQLRKYNELQKTLPYNNKGS